MRRDSANLSAFIYDSIRILDLPARFIHNAVTMKKWFFFLGILAVIYIIARLNSRKEYKSPFLTRINQAVTIAVWALLIAYILTLGYYLYSTLFK